MGLVWGLPASPTERSDLWDSCAEGTGGGPGVLQGSWVDTCPATGRMARSGDVLHRAPAPRDAWFSCTLLWGSLTRPVSCPALRSVEITPCGGLESEAWLNVS